MKSLFVTIAAAAALALSGCCSTGCGPVGVPSCAAPCPILNYSPVRACGVCRPNVARSWSCANTYNCPDHTTCRSYY